MESITCIASQKVMRIYTVHQMCQKGITHPVYRGKRKLPPCALRLSHIQAIEDCTPLKYIQLGRTLKSRRRKVSSSNPLSYRRLVAFSQLGPDEAFSCPSAKRCYTASYSDKIRAIEVQEMANMTGQCGHWLQLSSAHLQVAVPLWCFRCSIACKEEHAIHSYWI